MQSKTVLIVEDNLLIGMMLEQMVFELGHIVLGPYSNLNDGYDHARHDMVDFALLDFDLGEGTDALPIAEVLTSRHATFWPGSWERGARASAIAWQRPLRRHPPVGRRQSTHWADRQRQSGIGSQP